METPKGLLICADQDEASREIMLKSNPDTRIRSLKPASTITLKQGTIFQLNNTAYVELEVDTDVTVRNIGDYEGLGVKLPTGEFVFIASGYIFPFDEDENNEQVVAIARGVRGQTDLLD